MDLCGTKTLFRSKLKVTTRKRSLADILLQSIQISTAKNDLKLQTLFKIPDRRGSMLSRVMFTILVSKFPL